MNSRTELERCHALGMRAGIVSCVTNDCTSQQSLSHTEVVEVAERASGELCAILRACLGAASDDH